MHDLPILILLVHFLALVRELDPLLPIGEATWKLNGMGPALRVEERAEQVMTSVQRNGVPRADDDDRVDD